MEDIRLLRGDFRFPWEESARETSAPSVSSGASAPSVSGGASALALLGRLFTENAVVPNKMSTFALIVRY